MTTSEEDPGNVRNPIQRGTEKKPPVGENKNQKRSRIGTPKLEAMECLYGILYNAKVPIAMKDLVDEMARKNPGDGDVRISEKTISRYIATMRSYNMDIESTSDGYRLIHSKPYPPLLLVWMAINNPVIPQRSSIVIKHCIEYLETLLRQKTADRTPSTHGTYQMCISLPLSSDYKYSPPVLDTLRSTAGCSDNELLIELKALASFFSGAQK